MSCDCEKYPNLELYREAIDKRIKETKKIKKNLELIAGNPKFHPLLWRCNACNQFWQSSGAWNWGAKEYIYKVPQIEIEKWKEKPYVKPDELLIYSAMLQQFEENNTFVERNVKCKNENCISNAIQYSVFCKIHHIESLQKAKALPNFPSGKMFEPYHFQNW